MPSSSSPLPATQPSTDHHEPKAKTTAAEQVQTIRVSVRLVWWSAVVLTLAFAALALWTGFVRGDFFALFYVVLAGLCGVAGYGALTAVKRHTPPPV